MDKPAATPKIGVPLAHIAGIPGYRRYVDRLQPVFKKKRNKAYATTVLSFLAISLFAWYAIMPTIQTIIYLRREIADKTIVNQKMEEKISDLITAQVNYQAAQERLTLVAEALPDNPDAVDMVRQIRNMTQGDNASISAVRVPATPVFGNDAVLNPGSNKITNARQVEFATNIVVTGPYSVIRSVLDGLVSLRRLVTIESINIAPTKETVTENPTQAPELKLTLKVNSYYLGL